MFNESIRMMAVTPVCPHISEPWCDHCPSGRYPNTYKVHIPGNVTSTRYLALPTEIAHLMQPKLIKSSIMLRDEAPNVPRYISMVRAIQ